MNKIEKMLSYLVEERYPDVLVNYSFESLARLDGMISILKELRDDEYVFRSISWVENWICLCENMGIDLWLVTWRRWVKNGED